MDISVAKYPETLNIPDEYEQTVLNAIKAFTDLYSLDKAEVSVTLTDNEYIRGINKKYRGIDAATDVLSFALNESDEPQISNAAVNALGDILISVPRAEEQAKDFGHSMKRELSFLTVHGMLHLLGYDHIEEEDRLEMEAEQRLVMEVLNIPREGEEDGE